MRAAGLWLSLYRPPFSQHTRRRMPSSQLHDNICSFGWHQQGTARSTARLAHRTHRTDRWLSQSAALNQLNPSSCLLLSLGFSEPQQSRTVSWLALRAIWINGRREEGRVLAWVPPYTTKIHLNNICIVF
ncbi:uncharacterized [Tachysurus ichikawai]